MNTCTWLQQNIHRFLDNDLSGADATRAAHHLKECSGCRLLQDQMDSIRSMVRNADHPPAGDGARERVYSRLEAAIAENQRSARRSFRLPVFTWQPAIATLAATAVALGMFVLVPGRSPVERIGIEPPSSIEMTRFLNLHDARAADLVAGDPVTYRETRAEAQAALIQDAEARVQDGL